MGSEADKPVPLADAAEDRLYGGKCVSLGTALRAGLPAPDGYALPVALVSAIASGDVSAARQVRSFCGQRIQTRFQIYIELRI